MKFTKFLKDNKGLILEALESLFMKLLKLQMVGGVKGWLISFVVRKFAKEVFEFIEVNVDYIEIKKKVNSTINNEDRNEATDDLNDVFNP